MIIYPHQNEHTDLLGGKAGALAQLAESGFHIPPWFAVTASDDVDGDSIIHAAASMECKSFAVRSSAHGEDGAEHSFAGQYDTFLYVSPEDLLDRIHRVQQSYKSEHLKTYQASKEISEAHKPTAIVQLMLQPSVSGVAFSADPVSGNRNQALISALWGTGSALVSGEADADTWSVDESNHIITRNIVEKTHQHVADSTSDEGVSLVELSHHLKNVPCLSDEQVISVAKLAKECEEHFGCPQDIEWAIESDQLYLLQSRPITTLAYTPDPNDPLTVWDNSNIAESYSGITSPMTFSFAERIYEHVYREFCKLLSVPKQKIQENDHVFSKMLGHIRGHVYYNLNSWYHVLAMLPGFSVNRSFMEQMMGVKEPMPEEIVQGILKQTQTNKIKDSWALIITLLGLVKNHRSLPKQIDHFYNRLQAALAKPQTALTEMNGKSLVTHYRELESQLLKKWDAPLINDFFAMIHYGVLKSLCEKWLNDESLQNTLLLDSGEIISAEPPRLIKAIAEQVHPHQNLTELLADHETDADSKLTELRKYPEIHLLYEAYLNKFGDRCLEELKLESPTVGDNPQSLLTGIGVMAIRQGKKTTSQHPKKPVVEDPLLKLTGVKKHIFSWVLKNAKNRVKDRENLRFERTRLFGRVRQIIVELGKQLHTSGSIDSPNDVFFLTIHEVMGVYENKNSPSRFKTLISERKNTQASYKTPPPDRFETRGDIENYTHFTATTSEEEYDGEKLHGMGACPGVIRGKVRVVTDPRNAVLKEGEILVAQQTDPGWVVLFPAASGLLVERGSMLSHSAIVARELQLPCIVSIRKVTTLLRTGDIVEMNGSTGNINILEQNS